MLEIQGVSKEKVYGCKIIPKLMRAQNSRKLSVSPSSKTPSGGNVLLKGTLKMACPQKQEFIYAILFDRVKIWGMLYKLFKILTNLMHAETNARCPKTGLTSAF